MIEMCFNDKYYFPMHRHLAPVFNCKNQPKKHNSIKKKSKQMRGRGHATESIIKYFYYSLGIILNHQTKRVFFFMLRLLLYLLNKYT